MQGSVPVVLCVVLLLGCGEPERQFEDAPYTPPIADEIGSVSADTQFQPESLSTIDTLVEADAVVTDAFPAFFRDFQRAVRTSDPAAVSSLVSFREGGLEASDFSDRIYPSVFQGEMRDRLLRVAPSDVERRGSQRVITLHVGYDREGNVVPPEEAYTEAAATLTFDEGSEGYRLVRVDLR